MEKIIDYPLHIYFGYADGKQSRPLLATNILLDEYNFHLGLLIDLSSNLNDENEISPLFKEAKEIMEGKKFISSFYIESDDFFPRIETEYSQYLNSNWIVELLFNKNYGSLYSTKIGRTNSFCHFKSLSLIGIKSGE